MDAIDNYTFPADFLWGAATSAYQIEGAAHADGKKDSIWDVFCRKPGKILNGDTGEIATDHYHRWKEDIAIMKEIGIKSYRFSLSWSRIMDDEKPNPFGIAFYNQLIDELIKNGIEPVITLYHWDLPERLQEKGGWCSRDTVDAFVNYSVVAFKHYGDRVKLWITHNEPSVVAGYGHLLGIHAPGIADPLKAFVAAHHLLLSHGAACQALRQLANTKIGISLNLSPIFPANSSDIQDVIAAQTYDLFSQRFFLDALFKGEYPKEVLHSIEGLSSYIQKDDLKMISSPIDFLGINYYTRTIVCNERGKPFAVVTAKPNPHSLLWDFYPSGLKSVVEHVWKTYHPQEIYITENGTAIEDVIMANGKVQDSNRIEYIKAHLQVVQELIQSAIPIKGYFVWSLLDNFEWTLGYQMRFGIVYVEYSTLQRTIKASGYWYGKVVSENKIL